MNLLLHQIKTDFRHFRIWFALLWSIFLVQPWLARLPLDPIEYEPFSVILILLQLILGKFLVIRLVQADPLVGHIAGWKTRPLRRTQLVAAKSAMLLLGVLLPLMLAQGAYWLAEGFGFGRLLVAELELALLAGGIVFAVATLAALTANYAQVLGAGAAYFGGLVVWAIVLDHFKLRPQMPTVTQMMSGLLVAGGFLVAGFAAAWICQARSGLRRIGFAIIAVGVLAFLPLQMRWPYDFLKLPKPINQAVQVRILNDEDIARADLTNQVLWSHFLVTGLPPGGMATVREISGAFDFPRGSVMINQQDTGPFFGGDYRFDSWRNSPYLVPSLRGFFPPDTLWLANWVAGRNYSLPFQGSLPNNPDGSPVKGKFHGALRLDVFEITKLAELPLEPGARTLLPGLRLKLVRVERNAQGLQLVLEETGAAQSFSRDSRTGAGAGNWYLGQCLYVLHNPAGGEAFVLNPQENGRRGMLVLNQERRMRVVWQVPTTSLLAGLGDGSDDHWLDQCRLHVFHPSYQGLAMRDFSQDNYAFQPYHDLAGDRARAAGLAVINQATTAPDASAGQTQKFVDDILDNLPESWDERVNRDIRQKLSALGPAVVPALLHRLPAADSLEFNVIRPVLRTQTLPEHLPVLQESLKSSPAAAWLLLEKNWASESQAALKPWLKQRQVILPWEAVALAARARAAATYPDLAWHFAQNSQGHQYMLDELQKCPGFDLAGAVKLAWKRARLGYCPQAGLALAAAQEGLPDALSATITQLDELPDNKNREILCQSLAALVQFNGPPEGLATWLRQNALKLRFDPASRRYRGE